MGDKLEKEVEEVNDTEGVKWGHGSEEDRQCSRRVKRK